MRALMEWLMLPLVFVLWVFCMFAKKIEEVSKDDSN